MDYYKHFEAVAKWNGWSETQKAQQLVMSLEGEAMKLIGELKDEVLEDYHRLVNELNRKYDPDERAQAYKIEFCSCTRRKNGNIMAYAQELRRLVSRAYPEMDSAAHESFVLDQFTMGLGSLEIHRHVQFGHPKDINQSISLAIEFEAFETAHGSERDCFRKPRRDLNAVYEESDNDEESLAVACTVTDAQSEKYKKARFNDEYAMQILQEARAHNR